MPASYRLEIWTRDNADRVAIFTAATAIITQAVLKAEETLSADVPLDDPAVAYLTRGSILRLQEEESGDFSLWRLVSTDASRSQDNATSLRIRADALWMDLRHGKVRQLQSDGRSLYQYGLSNLTPEAFLQILVDGYDGTAIGFELGTVDPAIADTISLDFDDTSPLAALRMIEEAAYCEAFFRLNGPGTVYLIDLLTRIGSEQGGARLAYEKNVLGMSRAEDDTTIETRLYARGSGLLTLADAKWRTEAVTGGNVISFPATENPIYQDGALTGMYWYIPGKGYYPIVDSDAEDGTITVTIGGNPALSPGEVGQFTVNITGRLLDFLQSPSAVADYDIRVGNLVAEDVPDADNLIENPDLSEWSGGLPVNWTRIGETLPTVTESVDPAYVKQGSSAARVVATVADAGLISAGFLIPESTTRPYLGFRVGMTVLTGDVRAELLHSDGTVYPVQVRPQNDGRNVYIELIAGPVHADPLPAGTAQLQVTSHGGAAEFYLDAAMVTATVGADVGAFVAGSGARLLWYYAANELEDRSAAKLEYDVSIVDLYTVDPTRFLFDKLDLGDDVTVADPTIGQARLRVVELERNVLNAEATRVVIAENVRRRIPNPLRPELASLNGRLGQGGTAPAPKNVPAILSHSVVWDPVTETASIPVVGNERTASIELRLKLTAAADWPEDPDDVLNDRTGTFEAIVIEPGGAVFYQLLPKDGSGAPGQAVTGAADRTLLSMGVVTVIDFKEFPSLLAQYEAGIATVLITTPSGPKTYTGLTGAGLLTYQAGVTPLDSAFPEAAFLQGAERSYTVDYTTAGGVTRRMWTGSLHGPLTPTKKLDLLNFREWAQDQAARTITHAFTPDVDVAEILLHSYQRPLPFDDDLWPTELDAPTIIAATPGVEMYIVSDFPDAGNVRILQAQGRADDEITLGQIKRVRIFPPAALMPVFDYIHQVSMAYKEVDLYGRVSDPLEQGGTLKVWVNKAGGDSADVTGPPDGTVVAATTAFTFTPATIFSLTGGGTDDLLDGVTFHPSKTKTVAFEFVSTDGRSTGVHSVKLDDWWDLVDEEGELKAGSIKSAVQFAAGLTPVGVGAALPADGTVYTIWFKTSDTPPTLYRWSGSAWVKTVDVDDIAGQISEAQIEAGAVTVTKIADGSISSPKIVAGAVVAGKIAAGAVTAGTIAALAVTAGTIAANAVTAGSIQAGAVTATAIDAGAVTAIKIAANAIAAGHIQAGAVTAAKISIGELSELSDDAGIIVHGRLENAGGSNYIDMDATGSGHFLHTPDFYVTAGGAAHFGGVLDAASGTFEGDLSAAGGTFAGDIILMNGGTIAGKFETTISGGGVAVEIEANELVAISLNSIVPAVGGLDYVINLGGIGNGEINLNGDTIRANGVLVVDSGMKFETKTVSQGPDNSGGSGFQLLRVPN